MTARVPAVSHPAPPSAARPVRVLAVTNMYPTPEDPVYGTFIESQMRSVADAGGQVTVDFINGRRSDWNYLRGAARVRRLARSGRFDLVHAHYGLTGFACAWQPLPLVISFCGDDLLGTPDGRGGITRKSRLILGISHQAAYRASAVIVKSEEMASRLPLHLHAPVHVIPNGVDTTLFSPGDREQARRRLGLDSTARLIIFPHTPTERRKRIDLAHAAEALLQGAGRLWVVEGMNPLLMPDHYRAADCLLLTSDWEGSANTLKEALCCDLPVVSVDAGDARHWVEMAPGSRLVARNPEAIAAGLRAVLERAGRVDGEGVRRAVGLAPIARRVLQVYEAALVGSRVRGLEPAGRASTT